MSTKLYDIFLGDKIIGTTEFEKADAPMGVVFGRINLDNISSGYEFFKSYCTKNGIDIITDNPEQRLIATSDIRGMKILNPNGVEIKGQATSIDGMDEDVFEITVFGLPYPFYQEEFPLHVKAYEDQFKEHNDN
jgi:hypothetical protein